MELLPMAQPQPDAAEIVRLANEQEAMGGFAHLEEAPPVHGDPAAAGRIHGKPNPRVHIETYGCQMNERDTEIMYGMLERLGYTKTEKVEESDVLLFNTCAVRESAVEHAFGRIGQLKPLKYTNPGLVIGVCGCVPQVEGQVDRIKRLFPYVDLIFGTHNLTRLPSLIERAYGERETVVDIWDSMPDDLPEELPSHREGDLKAWITIMYGCNKKCTYCIVPQTRGSERSRLPEAILAEAQELGRHGFKEVTLLGQNVNAYGRDLGDVDFGDLLTLLDRNTPGIERIRFTTNHPKDFTPKMIDAIAASEKVCEWFHLPVQSGADSVLRRMKRSYNRRQYLDLVRRVREAIPHAVITTDIIVGFPGETEAEFAQTLTLVEEVGYDAAFMFMYSERQGTAAAQMGDRLSVEAKKERLQRLMAVQNRIGLQKNQVRIGSVEEILVEGLDKGRSDRVFGRTRGNILVTLPGDASLRGQCVPVRITTAQTWTLAGEPAATPALAR
jgi:tRNA-2-methylthio-N6-dimethylallyladenosine synthase